MALIKPCPRCLSPLEIPQPLPDQIRCDKCGAVIKNKSRQLEKPKAPTSALAVGLPPAESGTAAIPPVADTGSFRRILLVVVLLGGLLFIGMVPVVGLGLAWIFSDPQKKPTDDSGPVEAGKLVVKTPQETKQPLPPPPDPRIKIVQPAVDKGVAFLKTKAPELKGLRCGYAGLNGLTLLECGVPPDDPAILQIADVIRAAAPSMNQIYDLASSLFFLNRWDESRPLDEKDLKLARSFALRIIAGQLSTGIWGYGGVLMRPEQEAKLLASLQDGNYKPTGAQVASMSNTQFAMLAIWGARKHGVPVREPLLSLAAYFHANQHPDGCWHYPGHSLKATSTCAALISLAIEVALLEDKEFASTRRVPIDAKKKKADVEKAFAFVAKTIGRKKSDPNPGTSLGYGGALFDADAMGDLYFLWTLERVGVIYSKDVIDGKDWYDWGYPIVLQAQQPDGSWSEKHRHGFGPLIDTPFALLFLRRANIARDLTEMIRTHNAKAP